ncbi:hypothetical protein F3Y22_tig00113123pilonHSYRG00106 [Hibiscus syriacus]|uniref:Uncharacterized protein n=1 Tax=Hibiscus syriacus TaxID=106335 RepID=A0A6A2XX41_HIBSY|nr:hypothetical protein F3Y22_tig00113123pilonHSYRG00106 [Hibiscus syriacus]
MYELPSDLSSPVESVGGSTETDSDEEDYLVRLTRQMARYTLEDDFSNNHTAFASKNSKFQQVQQNQVMEQHNPRVWGGKKQHHQQHVVHRNSANSPSGNVLELVFSCLTVLLQLNPARSKALNLNLDEINAQSLLRSRFKASVTTDSGDGSRLGSGGNKFRKQQGISREILLPQEWSY